MKKLGTFALCLSFILGLSLLAEAQKIKTVDGVKIISNGKKPKPPKGIPSKLVLEEKITLGDSEDPEKSFAGVEVPFAVAENGTIYALDMKACHVKIFDDSGKFIRTFAKQGQGPGELSQPSGIQITPEGTLMVEDAANRRLAYYSYQGEHIKDVSTATKLALVQIRLDSQGNMLGMQLESSADNKFFFEYKKYDKHLNPLFTLVKIDFPLPIPGSGNKMNVMDMVIGYQFDNNGNVFFGRNQEYEIKVFSPDGKHIRTIKKDFKAEKVTQEDIDEMLETVQALSSGVNVKEMFEFPKLFPPFQGFVLDEHNRLYVRTYTKGKVKDEYVIDIFNEEGIFISQLTTKADFRIWKNNKVYSVEENDDGYKILKRYSTSWEK